MRILEPSEELALFDRISTALEESKNSMTLSGFECFVDGDLSARVRCDLAKLFAKHAFPRVSFTAWNGSATYVRAWDRKGGFVKKVVSIERKTA